MVSCCRDLFTDKRLIFLFIKDLMDGVNGAILDLKERRDNEVRRKVPFWAKIVSWIFLAAVAAAILFFIYLFGVQQTSSRQKAWFKSFVVWIVLEVVLVSSAVVFVQHLLIPLVALKDVRRVQERVVRDIVSFNAKVKRTWSKNTTEQRADTFNAAAFLFPSYILASANHSLKESAVITRYHTSFPKKAFSNNSKANNLKGNYDLRFAFLKQALSRIAIFALTSVIQLPPPVQDALTEVATSIGFGYIAMLHVRLYRINFLLAFAPLTVAILVVHFLAVSGKADARLDMVKTVPVDSSDCDDVDIINEMPVSSPTTHKMEFGTHSGDGLPARQSHVWKSRRSSAAEGLALANLLARRLDVRSPSLVHPDLRVSDCCSSDSEYLVTCDEFSKPVIVWEDDDGIDVDKIYAVQSSESPHEMSVDDGSADLTIVAGAYESEDDQAGCEEHKAQRAEEASLPVDSAVLGSVPIPREIVWGSSDDEDEDPFLHFQLPSIQSRDCRTDR